MGITSKHKEYGTAVNSGAKFKNTIFLDFSLPLIQSVLTEKSQDQLRKMHTRCMRASTLRKISRFSFLTDVFHF